jgi:hypothetical protein
MGNCATCCGKTDTNEIVTEKQNYHQKLKGVSNDAPGGTAGYDHSLAVGAKKGG